MNSALRKSLLAALMILTVGCASQTKFSSEIDELMQKGVTAGHQKDYFKSIQYFEEARKISPEAPDVFYNLGLAESNIPGRELRAMAWFGAYLAAKPDASNAHKVKKQIAVLEDKNLANIETLIKLFRETTEQVKESEGSKDFYLSRTASFWLALGNVARAQELASRMSFDMGDNLATDISRLQAKQGDFAGALKTVDGMASDKCQHSAEYGIAVEQGKAGDFVAASQTAIRHDVFKGEEDPEGYREAVAREKDEEVEQAAHLSETVSVSSWLKLFTAPDEDSQRIRTSRFALMPLNAAPFMDITAFVKSIPSKDPTISDENYKVGLEYGDHYFIDELEKNILRIIDMRNFILEKSKKLETWQVSSKGAVHE